MAKQYLIINPKLKNKLVKRKGEENYTFGVGMHAHPNVLPPVKRKETWD